MLFKHFIQAITLLIYLSTPSMVKANLANPNPITETQSDGTSISLRVMGDEFDPFVTTEDGYTVLNKGGVYYYAVRNGQGNLVPTGRRADVGDPPKGLGKKLRPTKEAREKECKDKQLLCGDVSSHDAIETIHDEIDSRRLGRLGRQLQEQRRLVATKGTLKNLVVLIKFADHTTRTLPSRADVDILMNQVGGHPTLAPTGSVRDIYTQSSYGQLDIQSTVADWVTVPQTEAYYANSNSGLTTLTHTLIRDALALVDPSVNFNDFDTDNDNYIDAITFLHSGYAAEFGGTDAYGTSSTNRIWSHKWSIYTGTWTSAEGVRVYDYNISPGVWGTSGSAIGRIGVIGHELGHFLGLPDLYDGSGGSGIGSWGLMANSWGFSGSQRDPPIMSAWSREQLGWDTYTEITEDGVYTVDQAGAPSSGSPQIYMIRGGVSLFPNDEFLLIENRQPTGFENTMPTSGLAIYHIDNKASYTTEGYPGMAGWPTNGNHYRVALLQRDGGYDLEKGLDRGDSSDLWRQGHELSPSTNVLTGPFPNTDAYQGGNVYQTGIKITEISTSGPTMTFRVTGLGCSSDTDCDDGNFCNGAETCNLFTNQCQAGVVVSSGTACDDSNVCTVGDTCDGSGTCESGPYVVSPTCPNAKTLTTTYASNNGSSGNVFKVTTTNEINVNAFKIHATNSGSGQAIVWARSGDYAGFENSSTGWTKIQDVTVASSGTDTETTLPNLLTPYAMAAGSTHSFHVWTALGARYTNGAGEGQEFACIENPGDMVFYEGKGCGGQFSCTFSPRVWNGKIEYTMAGPATPEPTSEPTTSQPTTSPSTAQPTSPPTKLPTRSPTSKPTANPTNAPTNQQSDAPTRAPTSQPTDAPTPPQPTISPSKAPTSQPTELPTRSPTSVPTKNPASSFQPSTSSQPSWSSKPTEGAAVQGTQTGQTNIGNTTGTGRRELLEAIGLDISLANALGNATQKAIYDVACTNIDTSACDVEIVSVEKRGAGYVIDYETIFTIECPTYLCTGVNEQIDAVGSATSTKLEAAAETSLLTAITLNLEVYANATNNTDQSLTDFKNEVATLEIAVVTEPVQISYDPMHPLFPTQTPSTEPSSSPSDGPSELPSSQPSTSPTSYPTTRPSAKPTTAQPTDSPTHNPTTANPSKAPTNQPSNAPTIAPTNQPTDAPTQAPTALTGFCTDGTGRCLPSNMSQCACAAMSGQAPEGIFGRRRNLQSCQGLKSKDCSNAPACQWAGRNGCVPASAPTTSQPTDAPTPNPTNAPVSRAPTSSPSRGPTNPPVTSAPSKAPSDSPTHQPSTGNPTSNPTPNPTNTPTTPFICGCSITAMPTPAPTSAPTNDPTSVPTRSPTDSPTNQPTNAPIASTPSPTSQPVTGSPTAKCIDPNTQCDQSTACIESTSDCCTECCSGSFYSKRGRRFCN